MLSGGSTDDPGAQDHLAIWKLAFERYMRGTGHPDHPDVRRVVSAQQIERDRGSKCLRPRLLVHTIWGTDYPPVTLYWRMRVCNPFPFTHHDLFTHRFAVRCVFDFCSPRGSMYIMFRRDCRTHQAVSRITSLQKEMSRTPSAFIPALIVQTFIWEGHYTAYW